MADDREHQVRQRAYRIWQDEGEPSGRDQEHWSRAEAELDGAAGGEKEELIADAGNDLPFGEPEDTGAQDAEQDAAEGPAQGITQGASPDAANNGELPDTSGIAAAAQPPIAAAPIAAAPIARAPATKGRKGKGSTKPTD